MSTNEERCCIIKNAIKDKKYTTKKLKGGKQGIVGIFETEDKKFVYKLSNTMMRIGTHEYRILESLANVNKTCKFFLKPYCLVDLVVDKECEDVDDIFDPTSKEKYGNIILGKQHGMNINHW